MPNWKKIIVSGSDAVLNTVQAISFTGSLLGAASTASYVNPLNQTLEIREGNSLYFYSTGNTYYSYLYQNSTNLALIPNANVGIGIASPLGRVHIKGSGTTLSTTSLLVHNANNEVALLITDDKNIGILTTTPSASLDIAQSGVGGNYNALFLRAGNSATTSGSNQISFGYSAQTNYAHAIKTRHQSSNAIDNAIDFHTWKFGDAAATSAGQYVMTIAGNGNVGIGTKAPAYPLDASGSGRFTSALTVGPITGTPSAENTLNVYPPPAGGTGEGGQILLAASGGLYTSASMLDNYQNKFRILRGTNAGSDAFKFQVDLGSGQLQIPNYSNASSFPGTAVANLSVDSSGNVLTSTVTSGYTGTVTIVGNPVGSKNLNFTNGILTSVT